MREATTFSRILEMKLKYEIGRKLLRSSVGRDGFLKRGWTRACLNDDGKISSERERLTRFVMIGPNSLKQCFKRKVGMESRGCTVTSVQNSIMQELKHFFFNGSTIIRCIVLVKN